MKSYWDLTKKERSVLGREEVQSYLDYELMEKGILKAAAPELKALKPIEEIPTKTYYEICGLYFDTYEKAKQVALLRPLQKDYDYEVGSNYRYAKDPYDTDIGTVDLYDKNDLQKIRTVLVENKEIKDHNEKLQKEYNEQKKKEEECLQNMLNDWMDCCNLKDKYQKVLDTKAEYIRMTGGDEIVAKKFLLKVYSKEDIAAAEEWFGVMIHETCGS
jgi:hypothetical protein